MLCAGSNIAFDLLFCPGVHIQWFQGVHRGWNSPFDGTTSNPRLDLQRRDGGQRQSSARGQVWRAALGCELHHANDIVYADHLETGKHKQLEPVGVNCSVCERLE